MTTVLAAPRRHRALRRPGSAPVMAGASAAVALHWLDAAFVTPWHGDRGGTRVPAALGALALVALAAWVWPRLPRGPRALSAFLAGLVTITTGGLSVTAVAAGSPEGGAWSGLLLLPAGALMLGCAVATLRHGPARPWPARWSRRLVGTLAAGAGLLWVVMPVGAALFVSGKPRTTVAPGALGIPRQDVRFESTDGLRLAGWYVPSRNGAAILLVHGGGGNRGGVVRHARMLARHGYGVLLYDERGRGASQGAPDGIGWTWQRDVAGALRWLQRRPDVDPARIGALGLSTGAEAVVQAAAERADLHAVVADGVEARSLPEAARVAGPTDLPYWATLYAVNGVLTRTGAPPDLGDLVGRLRAPTLLIAAGRAEEARFGRLYARRSGGRAQLWEVPDAGHTRALRVHPRAYEARVTGFFDRALPQR